MKKPATKEPTVLVVDDERLIRWTLAEALKEWGYAPVEAADAGAALGLYDSERPALVLLDINLPDRSGLDVLLLAEYYLRTLGGALRRGAWSFSPEVGEAFRRYAWPGNVRERRNVIERVLILEEGGTVTRQYLPPNVAAGFSKGAAANSGVAPADVDEIFRLPPAGVSVEVVELSLVRQALTQAGGVQKKAAKLLGLSRDQFRYRLKKIEGQRA